jgi:hypothetical protein
MSKTSSTSSKSSLIKHREDKKIKDQFKRVFEGFFKEPQSMKMLSVKLKIDRANICWFCRDLRKENKLGIVKRGVCAITKQRVNYYTTNPELFPISKQTKLF